MTLHDSYRLQNVANDLFCRAKEGYDRVFEEMDGAGDPEEGERYAADAAEIIATVSAQYRMSQDLPKEHETRIDLDKEYEAMVDAADDEYIEWDDTFRENASDLIWFQHELETTYDTDDVDTVVAPYAGAIPAGHIAGEVLDADVEVVRYSHFTRDDTEVSVHEGTDDDAFEEQDVLIIDDWIETGETLAAVGDYLNDRGAGSVEAFVAETDCRYVEAEEPIDIRRIGEVSAEEADGGPLAVAERGGVAVTQYPHVDKRSTVEKMSSHL